MKFASRMTSAAFQICVGLLLLFATLGSSSRALADDFNIEKFMEVYSNGSKEKNAQIVYAMPDASITEKGSPGAIPAIRLNLSEESEHLVMQDLPTTGSKNLDVSVEVWASSDLLHGKGDGPWSDAGPGTYYIQAAIVHPNVDFWFLRGVGHGYFLTNLSRGKWNKVVAHFTSPYAFNPEHFEFHVPAGTGFMLLRNFRASHTN